MPFKDLETNPLVAASALRTARTPTGPDVRGAATNPVYAVWSAATAGEFKIAQYELSVYGAAGCTAEIAHDFLPGDALFVAIQGISDGDSRSFRIIAHDEAGRSADSGCSGSIQIDSVPPPAISTLVASRGDEGSVVKLNLTFPADKSDINAVEIRRTEGSPPVDCSAGIVSMTVTNIVDGPVYDYTGKSDSLFYYRACAVDIGGNVAASGPTAFSPSGKTILFARFATHDANFGGFAGADTLCTQDASAALLAPTKWRALLSTSTLNARDRITVQGPLYRPDLTTTLIGGRSALWVAAPAFTFEVSIAANGIAPTDYYAYTGSDRYGRTSTKTCANWTNNTNGGTDGSLGVAGASATDYNVLEYTNVNGGCSFAARLYCVSQPPDIPAIPVFTAQPKAGGGVDLTLTPHNPNPSGVVKEYVVYRTAALFTPHCDAGAANGTLVNTLPPLVPATFIDAGSLDPGATYDYLACALDEFGNVLASTVQTATTELPPTQ